MRLYMAFHRDYKSSPTWIVTLGLKRSPKTWIICGRFCDN